MALSSPGYLVFVGIAWGVVRILPSVRFRKCALLASSLIFYALLDLRYLFLLIGLSILIYGLGIAIAKGRPTGLCTAAGIAAALIILAVFKYSAAWFPALRPIFSGDSGGWLLPVGISFFTFQAVSYLADIRRGRIEPVRDGLDFGLYMTFFPKIVAGPIVRPGDFFREMAAGPKPAGRKDLAGIFLLFLRGLFKKVVIADTLAGLAGVGFRAAALSPDFPAPVYWRSFYLFAFQIYADFSGYTDIARASARLLGIELPENFRHPYLAASVTEFWNRWHMSLTQWFREYVFFPLNRAWLTSSRRMRPEAVQAATTIATMLLIGLWHGAGPPFLVWGLWHGVWLCIDKWRNRTAASFMRTLLSAAAVFHLTAIGWVVFRSDSLAEALQFFRGMIAGGQWFLLPECSLPVAVCALAVLTTDLPGMPRVPEPLLSSGFFRGAVSIAAMTAVGAVWLLGWAAGGGGLPFIYGNF